MKRTLLFLLTLLCPSLAFAQAGGIITGGITVLSSSGRPVAGASVTVCNVSDNGVPCLTTVNIYQDPALTIPAPNPGRTDANGNFIAFASPGQYHITFTGNGVSTISQPFLVTVSTPSAGGGNVLLAGNNVMTGQNSFTNNNTFSGNNTLSGQNTLNAYNINNIVTVDGQKYTTANAALGDAVCTAGTGCTIDMRGNKSAAALALGSFDPGQTPVTLLLGPYTYTTSGITLRTNFHLLGDAGGGPTSSSTGTFINPTTTSSPIIQMPATAATGIADVNLSNFRIQCAAGNTNQIAMNITAPANSGLWYSTMNNILIQGCGGEGMLFASAGYPAINQWIELRSVFINRQINGAPAIHIVGPAGQFITTNCQFDSIAQISGTHDNLPNYVVEDIVTPFVATYNIANYQMTSQGGGVAFKLRGTQNFTCDNCHFEHDYGILNAAQGNNYGNYGVAITNSAIYTSAVNAGAGYLITMDVNAQVNFENNSIYAPTAIDNFYLGNLSHLSVKGIFNQANGLPFTAGQSSMRIAEGIFSDSSGFKFVTVSTGAITAGARVNLAVTWTTPFADNGYAPFCFVDDFTTGATSQGVIVERANALPSASGISVTVFNPTGGTVTSNISCLAIRSGS